MQAALKEISIRLENKMWLPSKTETLSVHTNITAAQVCPLSMTDQ